jgi:hypothetical protein
VYVDVAAGTSVSVSDGVLPLVHFAGKRVVFLRVKEPGAGLYVFDPK